MTKPIRDLSQLLAGMEPVLRDGIYVYATVSDDVSLPWDKVEATVREDEGLSVVVTEAVADSYNLNSQFRSAWITLMVHSDLEAVGLTAAFSKVLGEAGISCNVIAGNYHDHILVPYEKANLALETLKKLQNGLE
ncbi:ACT domain-containing protein [Streptococcus hillyeri]|uniref:ACT domain-containing protein n=1 Tax=Streptococcus hillyeri TaxID=2282420 RepID=A0A3L9E0C6_9STRE|nr:ACT domain-containing protein [Streptococcus hillyeri]RLY04872.1 ACT domain-containing protein [Streptococcus hillyeri]